MVLLALLIGFLLLAQGILGMAAPEMFERTLRFIQAPPVIYLAALLRTTFGIVLIRAAPGSRAPAFLRVFGIAILIGGLLTPFVGIQFARVIFDWWSSTGPMLVRMFAAVSLALGIGTVYAVSAKRRES